MRSFTLLEIMIAVSVLTIGILGISSTFLSLAHLNTTLTETSYATQEARKMLEQVRAEDFDNILTRYGNFDFDVASFLNPQNPSDITATDTNDIVGKVTVTTVGGNSELLEIEVILDWRSRLGRNRQISLRSQIAKL